MKLIKSALLLLLLFCTFVRADEPASAPAAAPPENLFVTLSARGIVSALQGKDLTTAWRVLRVSGASEQNAFWQMMAAEGARPATTNGFSYTRGDVIYLAGQSYLVTYRVLPPANAKERKRQERFLQAWRNEDEGLLQTQAPPLEENTTLALSLIALGQGASLTDIKAFNPETDLLTEATKTKQKIKIDRAISQSNLKQVALAVFQYTQDYDEKYPPMRAARKAADWAGNVTNVTPNSPVQMMLMPYMKSNQIFLHPGTGRPYLPNYKLSQRSLADIENTSTTFLFYEDAPDAEGKRNVAFADGRVEALSEADFQKRRIAQGISASGFPAAMTPQQTAASRRAKEAAQRAAAKKGKTHLRYRARHLLHHRRKYFAYCHALFFKGALCSDYFSKF